MEAMRSIWKGSVSFGLVSVPVKLYSATEDHDVKFHQVHAEDGGRIRYKRVCELDGKTIEYADIAKAYESDDGRTIILTDEDFAQMPVSSSREIEVSSFVPADQIDPLLYDKSYYLEPATKSTKAYKLLCETLEKTDRIAVVSFALRQKSRLAALRVRDGVLVVQTLLWPDEVRAAEFPSLDEDVSIKPAELKMAGMLVESFADDFRPEEYVDEYRVEMQQLIDAKLEGEEAFPTPETEEEGEDAEVVDLLAALQRSVDRHKGGASSGRGRTAAKPEPKEDEEKAEEKPAPKRRTASRTSTRSKATETAKSSEDDEEEKPKSRTTRAKSTTSTTSRRKPA